MTLYTGTQHVINNILREMINFLKWYRTQKASTKAMVLSNKPVNIFTLMSMTAQTLLKSVHA